MKCVYHSDREAEFICSNCGQPVCRECMTSVNGKNVCKACAYNMQYAQMQYKQPHFHGGDGINGFLFFIFLAVPGLRHMYLGLMRRGFQFLLAFFALITLGIIMGNAGQIVIPFVFMIWFYSAFDSFNCRKLMAKGEKIEDKSIFDEYGIESIGSFIARRKKFTGIAIIVLGVIMLFSQLRHSWRYRMIPPIVLDIMEFFMDSIIPLLFIACGIYLLTRLRKRESVRDEE